MPQDHPFVKTGILRDAESVLSAVDNLPLPGCDQTGPAHIFRVLLRDIGARIEAVGIGITETEDGLQGTSFLAVQKPAAFFVSEGKRKCFHIIGDVIRRSR